jgi:UPF0755 protein
MKKLVTVIITMVFAVGAYFAWSAIEFLSMPLNPSATDKVVVEIPPGSSLYKVSTELETKKIIKSAMLFSRIGRFMNMAGSIQVGEYEVSAAMKPREIMDIFVSGQSIKHPIVIPEGFNIFEIQSTFNEKWSGRGDEIFNIISNPEYAKKLTGLSLRTLEGFLYPDTYYITKYTSAEDIVEQMYAQFQKVYAEIENQGKIKMNLLEHVTLASVIEKETGASVERPIISSVFHNRLKRGMRLQSDPTIIYGIWSESMRPVENITKSDITAHTPYNTYTVKALPIGPIANPGREALLAAVSPQSSEYLYFVSRNDGTHVFSETYEQHNQAVRAFQVNRAAREGKSWRDLTNKTK